MPLPFFLYLPKTPNWGDFLSKPHAKTHPVLKLANYEAKQANLSLKVLPPCPSVLGLEKRGFQPKGAPAFGIAFVLVDIDMWDWLYVVGSVDGGRKAANPFKKYEIKNDTKDNHQYNQ